MERGRVEPMHRLRYSAAIRFCRESRTDKLRHIAGTAKVLHAPCSHRRTARLCRCALIVGVHSIDPQPNSMR